MAAGEAAGEVSGAALADGKPHEIDAAAHDKAVRTDDVPLLVDYWAPWCGPCLAMAPAFEEAAAQLEPEMRLAKLNTDEEQAVGARFGIRSIPTMILFHGGQEIARHSGAMMGGDIVRWVESQLAAG